MERGRGVVVPEDQRPDRASDAACSLPAVVCVEHGDRRGAVIAALTASGFETAACVERGLDAVTAAASTGAELVVVDLSLVGALGVRLVGVLKAARSGCEVVVLTPLEVPDGLVLEAGADAVIHEDDVRGLREAAATIRARHASPGLRG